MATDQEHPEEPNDAELEAIVGSQLAKARAGMPEPSVEFVRTLGERLDAQFATKFPTAVQSAAARLPAHVSNGAAKGTNGKVVRVESNGHAATATVNDAAPRPAAVADNAEPSRRLRLRTWASILVAAASLFVAIIVWGPAYGWTAAIREWVVNIVPMSRSSVPSGGDARLQSDSDSAQIETQTKQQAAVAQDSTGNKEMNAAATEVDVVVAGDATDATKKQNYEKPKAQSAKKDVPEWKPFDAPLADRELVDRVDAQMAALWASRGIHPAAPASDVEFMRRIYLDLTGRIPSVNEVHEFLNDQSGNKRERLVDRLLAHHDHATHVATVWRSILLPEGVDLSRLGGTAKFDEWLAERFAANQSYDKIVRDLLQAEGRVSESGPLLFYAALKLNPEELAGKTSRAFLGVRMECAQCHNHPFDDVSQQDFWSFAAFFARISRPKGKMEATSPVLQVRDSEQGDVMIPESDQVVPPRLPISGMEIDEGAGGPPRRQQLVDWLTSANNGQFAQAAVNRVWAHLFGRGLVDPVDDMRPANPPLAPEVLDTLARDFAASHFDLRRLFRTLVLTKAYQLSSRSDDNDPARALHFAQMNIKSFSAEQLYDCISVATRQGPAAMTSVSADGVDRIQDSSRQSFVDQFRAPPGRATDYQAGIPQSLALMHGGLIHNSTDLATSGLLKSLAAPFFTDEQRIDTLFLSTLSRYPAAAERKTMLDQVTAAKTDSERQQVLGDVLWALLNSGEFSFNH